MKIKVEYEKSDLDVVGDVLIEVHHPEIVNYSDDELKFLIDTFSMTLIGDIVSFGIDDTVVRDSIFMHFGGYSRADKSKKFTKSEFIGF